MSLIFISCQTMTRTHQFSVTEEEHFKAVAAYREKRQKDKQMEQKIEKQKETENKNNKKSGAKTMGARKKTRTIYGQSACRRRNPVSVQSMTKTDTRDVKATAKQIKTLERQDAKS